MGSIRNLFVFFLSIHILIGLGFAGSFLSGQNADAAREVFDVLKAMQLAGREGKLDALKRLSFDPLMMESWSPEGKQSVPLSLDNIDILLDPEMKPSAFLAEEDLDKNVVSVEVRESGQRVRVAFLDAIPRLDGKGGYTADQELLTVWDLHLTPDSGVLKLKTIALVPEDFFTSVLRPFEAFLEEGPHTADQIGSKYDELLKSILGDFVLIPGSPPSSSQEEDPDYVSPYADADTPSIPAPKRAQEKKQPPSPQKSEIPSRTKRAEGGGDRGTGLISSPSGGISWPLLFVIAVLAVGGLALVFILVLKSRKGQKSVPVQARLEVKYKDGGEKSYLIRSAQTTIGRAEDNDLVLHDLDVSAHHAVLQVTKDGFYLRDLESMNGTSVNGRKIAEAWLYVNDELVMGSTRLTLE